MLSSTKQLVGPNVSLADWSDTIYGRLIIGFAFRAPLDVVLTTPGLSRAVVERALSKLDGVEGVRMSRYGLDVIIPHSYTVDEMVPAIIGTLAQLGWDLSKV